MQHVRHGLESSRHCHVALTSCRRWSCDIWAIIRSACAFFPSSPIVLMPSKYSA